MKKKEAYFKQKCEVSEKFVHPELGWGSFCMNQSKQCGMEVTGLWFCWVVLKGQVALTANSRSSALLGLEFLIFLLTVRRCFSLGFRIGQYQMLVHLAEWAGDKSCWKIKSASPQSVSREKH